MYTHTLNKSLGSGDSSDVSFTPPTTYTTLVTVLANVSSSNKYSCYMHNAILSEDGKITCKVKNDSGASLVITTIKFVLFGF